MDLAELVSIGLRVSIALAGLSIGLKTTPQDVVSLVRRPGELVRPLIAINIVMPLFALAMAWLLPLHPAVKIALFSLSVSPLPPLLPNKALKAGCRHDYVIGLLVAISVLSIAVVPLTLALCSYILGIPLRMTAAQVAAAVLSTVLAPLCLGVAIRVAAPRLAERAAAPLNLLATIVLFCGALLVLFSMRRAFLALIGDGTLAALAVFILVALFVGHSIAGPPPEKRTALALCTASRHPAIAIAIAHANFPDQRLAPAAIMMVLLLDALLSALYLAWTRRHSPRALALS
jgi:BASS family bile acid:Na+ symporter